MTECALTLHGPLEAMPRRDPEDSQWWPYCECGWNYDQGREAGTLYFDTEHQARKAFATHAAHAAEILDGTSKALDLPCP